MSVFPKSRVVWILIIGEAIRAMCHTSVGPLMIDFLMDEFNYSEEFASAAISIYSTLLFVMCIPGAFLGDTYLGRYKTMFFISGLIVLSQGLIVISSTSFERGRQIVFFVGLFGIATVYGFNRVNTWAFTAEQYRPDQKKEHDNAITCLYIMVNVGSTVSMIGAPIMRNVVGCMGKSTCYAIPWAAMFVAVVVALLLFIFCLGGVNKEQVMMENAMIRVYKCLRAARKNDNSVAPETKKEFLEKNFESIDTKEYEEDDKIGPLGSWLDNAYPQFSRRFIFDVRQVGRLTKIFLPLTLFWSCWYQQFSSWIIQGRYMDGRLGPLVLTSDLLYGSNPIFCVIFIALLSIVVYPSLEQRMNLTSLRKMATGIVLTALAFLICTAVWGAIYGSTELPDSQKAFVYDFTNCSLESSQNGGPLIYGARYEHSIGKHTYRGSSCGEEETLQVDLRQEHSGWAFARKPFGNGVQLGRFKHESANTVIRFLVFHTTRDVTEASVKPLTLHFFHDGEKALTATTDPETVTDTVDYRSNFISPEFFSLRASESSEGCATMDSSDCLTILGNDGAESKIGIRERLGGVYGILLFAAGNGSLEMELVELVPPATISVLWQMPQFTVMALGECVVGHTALQFAYSQASASMKSAITCIYLFTALLGNVINVGILSIKMAESSLSHMIKSLIYTILLFLDFAVFVWVASGYIYVDVQETPEEVELLGGEETTGTPSANQA